MTWATLGRGRLAFALLMLPAVIYVLTWRLAPALYTVWLSLTQYNIVYDAAPQLNHLENYRRIVHDSTLGEALRLSVIFAVLATAVEPPPSLTVIRPAGTCCWASFCCP